MFNKIKRAISNWGEDSPNSQSSPQLRPASSLGKKEAGLKSKNSYRNTLPARFRNSIYKQSSPPSSEVLPLPPPKDGAYLPTFVQPEELNKVPEPSQGSNTADSAELALASTPKSLFIRRTSSFQESKISNESTHQGRDEDIIIFSSTLPVTIAKSASARIPRPTSLHKGSPDQAGQPSSLSSMNQDSSVVQWPRGGASSAANRSQEHFLRTHRRTSTGSDASFKDLQTNMATTPPINTASIGRPSLDRQFSRSSVASATTTTSVSNMNYIEPQSNSQSLHRKVASEVTADSSTSVDSLAAAAANGSHGNSSCVSISTSSQKPSLPHTHEPKREEVTKVTSSDSASTLATVRQLATTGTKMLKISAKKQHSRLFKLDIEQGRILWDSRKFGRINVEQIKELRKGKAARMYREQLRVQPEHEERWLTIIYSAMGKYKALHLVAPTKDTYEDWIMAVERMWSVKREVTEGLPQLQRKTNQWLKEHWMDADKNVDSKLGYEEIVRLCHRLNVNFSRKEIRVRFDQADEKKKGYLDFADFTHFVKLLKERREISALFNSITKSDSMALDEFTNFIINTQKSHLNEDEIKEIYGKHVDKTLEKFTVDSLSSFLVSADNPVIAPKHAQVHQDMSQTLSSYYISSSHNTYLLGHQLTGVSSIEGYIRALQSGCRCVELDCWDGSDGQPVIYHGRTLTSKILFRDVIEAISTYAFVNSPYPLILSLELHCDLEQQDIMANIMKTKLGSWLVVAPLDSNGVNLPSPDELKFKILVKSKVLPPDAITQEYSTDTESESDRESESDSDGVKQKKTKTKKVRIAKALSEISIYCQSRHFPGFTHEGCSPFKIISFSERVSLRHCKQSLQEYINMNKTHLTRVYPAGFRINSTNYDPHHHWAAGAQVVALNYQNHDRGMQMNSAMFTMNGHCGYVLKPSPLRLGPGEICNHDKAPTFVKSHPVEITLEVISAQQLPRPNEAQSGDVIDPLCEVELLVPGQPTVKYKTRHVSDNGFNPVWQETFKFRVDYEHHELVFFRFVVQDEDIKFSDLIASYCISLDCLQEGYRHIQLHDPSGDPYLYSTLFIKVSIEPIGVSGYLAHVAAATASAVASNLSSLPSKITGRKCNSIGSNEPRSSTESSHEEELTSDGRNSTPMINTTAGKETLESVSQRPLPLLPQHSVSPSSAHSPQLTELPPLPPTPPPK